jgi:asparagine synthase (glutamine-hydrolysing)
MRAPAEQIMLEDLLHYLPDDILVKVDRASMYCGLETRAPYLHPRVAEFCMALPLDAKIRRRQGKWLLRRLLSRYVPTNLFERPKHGFGLPIRDWLRGPLRDWAEALLNPSRLRKEGYLVPEPIQSRWREHISGDRNWEYMLWNVLMFQQWFENAKQR